MISTRSKKPSPRFPRAKIAEIVRGVLPKGREFELLVSDSTIKNLKVVRIVTPAWKNLRPPERISKVLRAVNAQLTPDERDRILRFSVLTPAEYREVVLDALPIPQRKGAVPLPAKRKAVRKTNAARAK
jgi:hypothetical protein